MNYLMRVDKEFMESVRKIKDFFRRNYNIELSDKDITRIFGFITKGVDVFVIVKKSKKRLRLEDIIALR
ncbi:MAG: hypothetical protein ACTSR2_01125 [Candidatus Hodarchaeales archaeon]